MPGGFGKRGVEGKIAAARYARENKIPYLGICLGMQVATIEFARNMAGLAGANSTEFDPDTPHPVIALITEWQDRDGTIEKRDEKSDLGGTMRLGAQSSDVKPGTLAARDLRQRRDRAPSPPLRGQRPLPRPARREAGLVISALHASARTCTEIMELPQNVHPWFIGVQFHPEFKSTPRGGHPLFKSFIKAALAHQARSAKPPTKPVERA